ncbi:MAG TPA: hypothetical protein VKG92_05140 [Flavobacteriales bacterium]|nr:hypothetical protein [Flavobacteriales bacterium]
MKTLILSTALLTSLGAIAQGQVKTTTASASGVTTEQVTHMTATVTAVDQKARTVTLKGQAGSEMTLTVSEEVKRLSEVKVGDQLNIGYLESVGLEFREPTAEEIKEPRKVTEQADRSDMASAPAGSKLRTIRAVVTLEGMSRWLNNLTVRGPKGNYFVIQVKPDMVKWESLHIGQTMVGTYTEALVMSIEPAAKK